MSNYSELLKDPRWQKCRLKILERDNFTCQKCGDNETTLNIHHLKYKTGKMPWDYSDKTLITLCKHCHNEISATEYRDIPFSKIRIYKSDNWNKGNRIMFVSILHDYCSMTIYDKEDNYIIGFNLKDDILGIINILNKAL